MYFKIPVLLLLICALHINLTLQFLHYGSSYFFITVSSFSFKLLACKQWNCLCYILRSVFNSGITVLPNPYVPCVIYRKFSYIPEDLFAFANFYNCLWLHTDQMNFFKDKHSDEIMQFSQQAEDQIHFYDFLNLNHHLFLKGTRKA